MGSGKLWLILELFVGGGEKKTECRNGIGRKQKGLPEVCKIQGRLKKLCFNTEKQSQAERGIVVRLLLLHPLFWFVFFPCLR